MAATTPTRRVLASLDSNKAVPSPILSPGKKAPTSSALSPRKQPVAKRLSGEFISVGAPPQLRSPALKRKIDAVYKDGDEKRVRVGKDVEEEGDVVVGDADALDEEGDIESSQGDRDSVFDTTALDSQNTTMTEVDADENVGGAAPIPGTAALRSSVPALTPEQARSTAQALRLRLQLSMYKIRTNQISIPLEQLTIIPRQPTRNTSFTSHPIITSAIQNYNARNHARSQSNHIHPSNHSSTAEKRRTPLPSGPSASSGTSRPRSADAVLGDNGYNSRSLSAEDEMRGQSSPEPKSSPAKMGFATPMLPRSRDVLDSGCQTPDLTSSVVKGRAADGLLKLMGVA